MKWKALKGGVALLLAAVLIIPTPSVRAEDVSSAETTVELESSVAGAEAPAVFSEGPAAEVVFNTGRGSVTVADGSVSDNSPAEEYFAEDGSYTIQTELNAFFPYEVQFTCNGETVREWFMDPDTSVEVGGHTFYVDTVTDGTAVTQMSLEVGGDTVVMYPEEKEFADVTPFSLLPLKEVNLRSIDLSSYTPVELTQVSVKALLGDKLADGDMISWKKSFFAGDDYVVNAAGDKINLSEGTYYGSSQRLEMIVGSGDQLDADAVRYSLTVTTTASQKWLLPTVYAQDAQGIRTLLPTVENSTYFYDYYAETRAMNICAGTSEVGSVSEAYVSLSVNPDVFAGDYHLRAFEGNYDTAAEAMAAVEITDQIFCGDMTQANAGYLLQRNTISTSDRWITVVAFDNSGNVTGCLPLVLKLSTSGISLSNYYLRMKNASGSMSSSIVRTRKTQYTDQCVCWTYTLYNGYAANATYYQKFTFSKDGVEDSEALAGAYIGLYNSVAEAAAAGAEDIRSELFSATGYGADYSQGIYITIIYGADGAQNQTLWKYCIKTEEAVPSSTPGPVVTPPPVLGDGTDLTVHDFKTKGGTLIKSYLVSRSNDSYGEYNFLTFLVDKDITDEELANLAPEFTLSSGAKLYTAGSSTEEISGESFHDFTDAVQYTVSAENGENAKNYWIQVVRAREGAGWLYINSLADPDAGTQEKDGVIYSTREVMLDSYHSNVHDILLANMGTEAIEKLSVELVSDTVDLHGYWTLKGQEDLLGYVDLVGYQPAADGLQGGLAFYGELWNLAKVRLTAKEGVAAGTDVSGTLTIKSADKTLMVLTLTGTVGDPSIITPEIPETVKYVPYGTMIQNSNKYSWNKVSYTLASGALPSGMTVRPNGEIYGVPREKGEFTFTVRMNNSYSGFGSSSKTYTLAVNENTDANVDGATDTGYELSQRVQNIQLDSGDSTSPKTRAIPSQMLVSQGVYDEFVDIYLDGVKLVEGQDYESEAGSTRITIRSATLVSPGEGTHTLGIEFRTGTDTLKRAAQNYQVTLRTVEPDNSQNGNQNNNQNSSQNNSQNNGQDDGQDDNHDYDEYGDVKGTEEIASEKITYTVVKGDNLSKIARRIGISLAQILAWNPQIKNPNLIFPGQVLIVGYTQGSAMAAALNPEGSVYVEVKKGDSLFKIARRNNVTLKMIISMNPEIARQKYIYPGQKVRIK